MNPVFQLAVSGLNAQSARVAVAASNIANARSLGVNPDPGADNSAAYTPQRVQQISAADGGVRTETLPVSPPALPIFDPGNPAADDEGVAFLPNVSLEAEFVEVLQASAAFEANLRVIQTQDELLGNLVDIKS